MNVRLLAASVCVSLCVPAPAGAQALTSLASVRVGYTTRTVLTVDVADQGKPLGTTALTIALRRGLDDLVGRLEADATRAPEALRAEILFPVDRLRNVNRGRIELRTFDPDRDLLAAEAVAAAIKAGQDPFAGRTGDIRRHSTATSSRRTSPRRSTSSTRTRRPRRARRNRRGGPMCRPGRTRGSAPTHATHGGADPRVGPGRPYPWGRATHE